MNDKKAIGNLAEDYAEIFIKNLGYTLLERNYYCDGSEIDLIVMDGKCLVFLEVRARKKGGQHPLHSITISKQRHLIQGAYTYIKDHAFKGSYRFDLLSVIYEKYTDQYLFKTEHFINFFSITDYNRPYDREPRKYKKLKEKEHETNRIN